MSDNTRLGTLKSKTMQIKQMKGLSLVYATVSYISLMRTNVYADNQTFTIDGLQDVKDPVKKK